MNQSAVQTLVRLLIYMRRFILETISGFVLLTGVIYWFSPHILSYMQARFEQRLAFFGVLEPIIALLKLSSVMALLLLAPWILVRITQALTSVLGLSRKFALVFLSSAFILFYSGATFCFFITLPFGINFLLDYQSEHLKPVITVDKFVNFTGLFILSFGTIFQLPLVMTMLCRLKACTAKTFIKFRRYAVLFIAVMAALLTPTPDIVNMAMMGLPLYILYEIGIITAKLMDTS
ncbi:MAG TPA: preprotein translocase subunit TatC [Thermodesulfobacteriaceae bacterium]|nr:preprotein translocase subunit TatC [Thermodesulfobacteriaceae bacterium]